jgi:hypothetical protein
VCFGDVLQNDAEAQLFRQLRVFVVRPGFAGIWRQGVTQPLPLMPVFQRVQCMQGTYGLRVLIRTIYGQHLSGFRMQAVGKSTNNLQSFLNFDSASAQPNPIWKRLSVTDEHCGCDNSEME